jgi:hypothetical protein
MDNLSSHNRKAALVDRLREKIDALFGSVSRCTPKHGNWLDQTEIEIS